jgi:predicted Zn-dependent protease
LRTIARIIVLQLALFVLVSTAAAQEDVLFRAMQDELDRSMAGLRIENMPPPYFLSYRILDRESAAVEARYGAVLRTDRNANRYLYIECRVGDPTTDNSYFVGSWRDLYDMRKDLAEENDYDAIRREIWLHTDAAYKNALENLARKQAYLQTHPSRDEVPDFSSVEPVVSIGEAVSLETDLDAWESQVRSAARVLDEFPALQDWRVSYSATAENRRYLNSEGSRHLKGEEREMLEVVATTQAEDGQRLTDFLRYVTADGQDPPRGDALEDAIREMASQLSDMAAAPTVDEYAGPVLFEGDAAAQFVSQLFATQLSPTRKPLSADEWMRSQLPEAKLVGRVKRRVFPEFVTVRDDPSAREWNGTRLVGYREVDDEGVVPEKIVLVDAGRLVDLPMARQPTKKIPASNGHAYTFENQWTAPVVTNLFVQADRTKRDLVKELRRLCRELDVEYGLLIQRLDEPGISRRYRWTETSEEAPELLSEPVVMYRVYTEDGRIEPVRGLVFDDVSIRSLRDVSVLGEDVSARNVIQPLGVQNAYYPAAIVTPSILVEEMEFKAGTVHEPMPVTANPMFAE